MRCSQRHPGSNSSAGSSAPLRRTTTYVHGSHSLTRFHPPLCQKWHVELIPSVYANQDLDHENRRTKWTDNVDDKIIRDPMRRTTSSALRGIVSQCCPRCRSGKIFPRSVFLGFPKMSERCPVCDLRFEREPGYFLGAMYISYGIALLLITLIAAFLWALTGWWITKAAIWAVVLFLPLAPATTLFSRILWIYLDQTVDPDPN